MPILNDIMDHSVIGRERRRGIQLGLEIAFQRGFEIGFKPGLEQGKRQIVLRMIQKRFRAGSASGEEADRGFICTRAGANGASPAGCA